METGRVRHRKNLSGLYLPFYDALCGQLPEEWQPYSSKRSFVDQDTLYLRGRSAPGPIVTNAKGGESPHNYGCATDWALFDGKEFEWPPVSDSVWGVFQLACEKVGLFWGGNFHMKDNPHAELSISVSWKQVKPHYDAGGIDAAEAFLKGVMK